MDGQSGSQSQSTSPESKPSGVFNRALTISSSHPLAHKDKKISQEKRARFEALDLEVLLQEFKNVAIETEQQQSQVVEEDETEPLPSIPGHEELQWLKEAGLSQLADIHTNKKAISPQALADATRGFMPSQVTPVKKRVNTLNSLLEPGPTMSTKSPSPTSPSSTSSTTPEDVSRIASLTEDAVEECTTFHDLGSEDQSQLQYLNLVLLTSMFETAGLNHKVGKKAKKIKDKKGCEGKCFGVNLETLVERDRLSDRRAMSHPNVPIIFSRIIDYLKKNAITEEGIFRKAGSSARVKKLRERCELVNGKIDFEAENAIPHDVAALCKQFLRETPEPLLSSAYLEAFYITQSLENSEQQEAALQMLAMLLPPVHQECLSVLLEFLTLVADNAERNKMGVANLAVVFAPSLFYVRGQKGQKMLKEVEMQVHTASTLQLMLERHRVLWNIPQSIMGQLRFLREYQKGGRRTSNAKEVKKVVVKKMKKKGGLEQVSQQRDTEKIKWVANSTATPPVMATVSIKLMDGSMLKLDVTESTNSRNVVEILLNKKGEKYKEAFLSEQGGNIGYRKLHPSTNIHSLFVRNNDATLVVETNIRR